MPFAADLTQWSTHMQAMRRHSRLGWTCVLVASQLLQIVAAAPRNDNLAEGAAIGASEAATYSAQVKDDLKVCCC